MKREKDFLRKISKNVICKLKEKNNLFPLKFLSHQQVWQTQTDGLAISIARIYGYNCKAQIWLDKFSGQPMRKLWYCINSERKNEKFDSLIKLATKKFGPPFKINSNNIENEQGIVALLKPLYKNQFGRPILEKYFKENEFYYGVYELDRTGLSRDVIERLSLRATDFFCDVIEVLQKNKQDEIDDYPGIENRQLVRSHIARERRSHVATMRKQKDDYKCSICSLKFPEKYGLGHTFAEAHHIIPLSNSNRIRLTKIEDLITVCANCHRMLHRMTGKQSDILQLKKLVRKFNHKIK